MVGLQSTTRCLVPQSGITSCERLLALATREHGAFEVLIDGGKMVERWWRDGGVSKKMVFWHCFLGVASLTAAG